MEETGLINKANDLGKFEEKLKENNSPELNCTALQRNFLLFCLKVAQNYTKVRAKNLKESEILFVPLSTPMQRTGQITHSQELGKVWRELKENNISVGNRTAYRETTLQFCLKIAFTKYGLSESRSILAEAMALFIPLAIPVQETEQIREIKGLKTVTGKL